MPILFVVNLNRGSGGIESVALRKTTFLAFRSPNISVFLFAVTPVFKFSHPAHNVRHRCVYGFGNHCCGLAVLVHYL